MDTLSFIGFSSLTYFLSEWFIHKLCHIRSPWTQVLFRAHHKHHVTYTTKKFIMDKPYKSAGSEIVVMPLILSEWICCFMFMDTYYFILFTSTTTFLLLVSDYLHSQIHIRNSWLEQNKITQSWFLELRKLHFIHHQNVHTNLSLGGITFIFDRIFGSYREEDPEKILIEVLNSMDLSTSSARPLTSSARPLTSSARGPLTSSPR